MTPSTIPITKPLLGMEESKAATRAILSGWVAQGPTVARFEERFASFVGAEHACAVSSCTTALHLSLLAVGVEPGDVVITVSHSFIATANSVRHCGADAVFVDVEPTTGNMSCASLDSCLSRDCERRGGRLYYRHVRRLLGAESPLARVHSGRGIGRVAAVMPVHQVGTPCDMERILQSARRFRLPVVEDAACAVGSEIRCGGRWAPVGRPHGDLACFSFHPRKIITTGEGGMITTDDPALADRLRLMRQHGMSVSAVARHRARKVIFERYLATGYNFRMTDIQAAVGLEQMARLPFILRRRRAIAARYDALLGKVPGVVAPAAPPYARPNWQSYVIRLQNPSQQRRVMQRLQDRGIITRRGIMCAHREPPYAPAWPAGSLPASEAATDAGIILPLYPQMGDADIRRVVSALTEALR
ncbi:MAG: DegT/DnrJ/EryC1/StrS family aminotransferase [Elusimicrobiota bacterium]